MTDFDAELAALHQKTHLTVLALEKRMARAKRYLHITLLEVEAEEGRERDSVEALRPCPFVPKSDV